MARPRAKNSLNTFGGLKLEPVAEDYLRRYLKRKGISLASFKRTLINEWIKTGVLGSTPKE